MEILLPLIILFVPISIFAKQICLAPSGCSIEIDTGFCPKCIEVKEEPLVVNEIKKVMEKRDYRWLSSDQEKKTTSNVSSGCTWRCVIEPCSDDMLPDGCRWVGR